GCFGCSQETMFTTVPALSHFHSPFSVALASPTANLRCNPRAVSVGGKGDQEEARCSARACSSNPQKDCRPARVALQHITALEDEPISQ
ncbi:hypothetical protein STEG23_019680, partial [Scotinomys teguina]